MRGYCVRVHCVYSGAVMKKYISVTEDRFLLTESEIRQAEVDKHVAAFLKGGGTIQQIPLNATAYNYDNASQAFVINKHTVPPKPGISKSQKNWKEYRHDKI
jgi:hypothetical protein